ncbi:MAG: hypothetical protein JWO03_1332, partial [Bacteroidetes bacterium]|nr:hypothetical protein [Bacteroidota bacterium]
KMQSTNQFIYWSKVGFFHDTLLDQVRNFRYGVKYFGIEDIWLAYAVIGVIAAGGVVVLYKIKQQGLASLSDPFVVLYSLLTLVWIINIAQTIILGTPYLTTRTALSYYVLFSLMLIFLIRDAGESKPWVNVTLVPAMTFLFCLHLALSVNLKYVREWWFDANTYQVIDFLDHYRHNYPEVKTISMSTTWLFNPSFDFYKSTGKLPWMDLSGIHPGVDTTSNTLFYYATSDEARQLKNYIPVKFFEPGTNVLMMHK